MSHAILQSIAKLFTDDINFPWDLWTHRLSIAAPVLFSIILLKDIYESPMLCLPPVSYSKINYPFNEYCYTATWYSTTFYLMQYGL